MGDAVPAEVDSYLAEVRSHLHLDPSVEHRVIGELAAHFDDKLRDLRAEGMPEGEAVREAIASFGGARSIARLLYQAYSRGTWAETFLACQPHLLAAALFAAHQWRSPLLLGLFSAVLIGIAVANLNSHDHKLKAAAYNLKTNLMGAKSEAVKRHENIRVRLNTGADSYNATTAGGVLLFSVQLEDGIDMVAANTTAISFTPMGTSNPRNIQLVGMSGRNFTISVNNVARVTIQ